MYSPAITIEKYPGVEDAFFLAGVSASQDCNANTTATLVTCNQQLSKQATTLNISLARLSHYLKAIWGAFSKSGCFKNVPS
jgi:hypothetical protein